MTLLFSFLCVAAIGFAGLWANAHYRSRQLRGYLEDDLRPIVEELVLGRTPDAALVSARAADPFSRRGLHGVLEQAGRLDLMPDASRSPRALAESDLVYWLTHRNELGAAPDEIELVKELDETVGGTRALFYVFRFRTVSPHWASQRGWMVGMSGPYPAEDPTRCDGAIPFSRLEPLAGRSLEEHVAQIRAGIGGTMVVRARDQAAS